MDRMIEPLLQAERALAVGLLDRAEALYAATLEADPRNAIATVGLARVAIERGDEEGALRLGRAALAIDPDDLVAQRLVARLDEIGEFRAGARPTEPDRAGAGPVPVPPPPTAPAEAPAADDAPRTDTPRPAVPGVDA
ncbi:MAG: hypothetical protein RL338_329, partial [Chloroflexota bacterium]